MRKMRILCAILLFMSAEYHMAYGISEECPAAQEIPSCDNLRTSGGFTYHVQVKLRLTNDCELGWYYQNGTFIHDSTDNWEKSGFVKNLTLTLSACENLLLDVDCPSQLHCKINFTVSELNKSTTNGSQTGNKTSSEDRHNGFPTWVIVLIVIVLVVCGLFVAFCICCLQRRERQNDVV